MLHGIKPLLDFGFDNIALLIGILQIVAGLYTLGINVPKQLWMFLMAPGLMSIALAVTLSDSFGLGDFAPDITFVSFLFTAYGFLAVLCDRGISEGFRDIVGGMMGFAFLVYAGLSSAMPADLDFFDWNIWRTLNAYSLTAAWLPLIISFAAIAAYTLRALGLIGEVRQFNEDHESWKSS